MSVCVQVSKALFKAHVEGRLKRDVMTNPDAYVEYDTELPQVLPSPSLPLHSHSHWQ